MARRVLFNQSRKKFVDAFGFFQIVRLAGDVAQAQ